MRTLGPDSTIGFFGTGNGFNFVRWATYLGFARLDQGDLVTDASRGMAAFITEASGMEGRCRVH